jgi:hypothetical protein
MMVSNLLYSSYEFIDASAIEVNRQRVIFAAVVWTELDLVGEVQLIRSVLIQDGQIYR